MNPTHSVVLELRVEAVCSLYDLQVFVADKSKQSQLKLHITKKAKKRKDGSYPESDRRNIHCNISLSLSLNHTLSFSDRPKEMTQ